MCAHFDVTTNVTTIFVNQEASTMLHSAFRSNFRQGRKAGQTVLYTRPRDWSEIRSKFIY